MKPAPPCASGPSAGGLAGPPDPLVELFCRRLGLGSEVAVEHGLEGLVVTHREGVIAGLVMCAHQEAMRFLVVWLELEKFFERSDRGLRFLPVEFEGRELLRRR